jgi:transposase
VQIHGNAGLLPRQRTLMWERARHDGWSTDEAAEAFAVSTRTVFRWLCRYDAGEPMTDRSSMPLRVPRRTPAETESLIERLRRLRCTSAELPAL